MVFVILLLILFLQPLIDLLIIEASLYCYCCPFIINIESGVVVAFTLFSSFVCVAKEKLKCWLRKH